MPLIFSRCFASKIRAGRLSVWVVMNQKRSSEVVAASPAGSASRGPAS